MSESAVQIIARGLRAAAEAAAESLDSDPMLEGATYSILEEDEDKGIWRIDAFPTTDEEAKGVEARLKAADGLTVVHQIPAGQKTLGSKGLRDCAAYY